MAANLRFSTGIEVLALMAAEPEKYRTSQALAKVLATNPVVVRRLLAKLGKAGLVTTSKGPSGGSKLAHGPKQITLRDVYRALGSAELLHQPAQSASSEAAEGQGIEPTHDLRRAIHGVFRKAQKSLEAELESVTLNQVMKKAAKKATSSPPA